MCSSTKLEKVVVFFYNPNIHPRKEYEIRKEENKRFCSQLGIEFVDCDYDPENWVSFHVVVIPLAVSIFLYSELVFVYFSIN